MKSPLPLLATLLVLSPPASGLAERLSLTLTQPAAPQTDGFHMGTSTNPNEDTITLTSQALLRNGKPWMPVMGEFHYTRYDPEQWRIELLKMKAGGIDIVSTYVFWNHHEEIEGVWDWSGRRDLRRFVETAKDVGLDVAVRTGPWCHGEVRNGGIPDWALTKGWRLRTDDPAYLDHVRTLYGQIALQLRGLLWKDGGPVIAIQLENEYRGLAEHLLTLKRIAREAGLDVPLYTRTGWPQLTSSIPFGEIAPLFGAYAEGFWDRSLDSMPGNYWTAFHFSPVRTDAAIATEQLGERAARDEADAARYPYLTCELGGGMETSYHRRIAIDPLDIESVALVKIGSGGNLPGYYMYHGGTNPDGRLTTLMEAQDTPMTNWNDMPVRDYDFYAPIGAAGQLHPHYFLLRRLHLMIHDFGSTLATMPATFPMEHPKGKKDLSTLRWAVRSDGNSGFLFVNNHQRGVTLPAHPGTQFSLTTADGRRVTIPSQPITVQSDACFVWPFGLDLGGGVTLEHASAQPICFVQERRVRTVFFAETPGVPAEFVVRDSLGHTITRTLAPSHDAGLTIGGMPDEQVRIVLLDEADSLSLSKCTWAGQDCVALTPGGAWYDDDRIVRESAAGSPSQPIRMLPAPSPTGDASQPPAKDGVFTVLAPDKAPPDAQDISLDAKLVAQAGPARDVPMGHAPKPVAAEPTTVDFAAAAVWKVDLTEHRDLALGGRLRLDYVGDVARVYIGDYMVTDNFFNGRPLEFTLGEYADKLAAAHDVITIAILPLRSDAPIYPHPTALRKQSLPWEPVAAVKNIVIEPVRRATFTTN